MRVEVKVEYIENIHNWQPLIVGAILNSKSLEYKKVEHPFIFMYLQLKITNFNDIFHGGTRTWIVLPLKMIKGITLNSEGESAKLKTKSLELKCESKTADTRPANFKYQFSRTINTYHRNQNFYLDNFHKIQLNIYKYRSLDLRSQKVRNRLQWW